MSDPDRPPSLDDRAIARIAVAQAGTGRLAEVGMIESPRFVAVQDIEDVVDPGQQTIVE